MQCLHFKQCEFKYVFVTYLGKQFWLTSFTTISLFLDIIYCSLLFPGLTIDSRRIASDYIKLEFYSWVVRWEHYRNYKIWENFVVLSFFLLYIVYNTFSKQKFIYLCMCVWGGVCAMAHVWRLEDDLWKLALSLYLGIRIMSIGLVAAIFTLWVILSTRTE